MHNVLLFMVQEDQETIFDENWPAHPQKYTLNRNNVQNDKFEKLVTNRFFCVEHIYHP